MDYKRFTLADLLGLEVVQKEDGAATIETVTEGDIFRGDVPNSRGVNTDLRNLAFWRLAQRESGLAVQVQPPNFNDVEGSATFFGKTEPLLILFRRKEL